MTENNVNVDTRTFEPQSSSALHREVLFRPEYISVYFSITFLLQSIFSGSNYNYHLLIPFIYGYYNKKGENSG